MIKPLRVFSSSSVLRGKRKPSTKPLASEVGSGNLIIINSVKVEFVFLGMSVRNINLKVNLC